jgi:hypothetical protein
MAEKLGKSGIGRRGFFGAVAAMGAGAVAGGAARPALASENASERVKARYQETEHVLRYYETNRYYGKES